MAYESPGKRSMHQFFPASITCKLTKKEKPELKNVKEEVK